MHIYYGAGMVLGKLEACTITQMMSWLEGVLRAGSRTSVSQVRLRGPFPVKVTLYEAGIHLPTDEQQNKNGMGRSQITTNTLHPQIPEPFKNVVYVIMLSSSNMVTYYSYSYSYCSTDISFGKDLQRIRIRRIRTAEDKNYQQR